MKTVILILTITIIFLVSCAKLSEPFIKEKVLEIEHIYQTTGYAMDVYVSNSLIYIAEDQGGFSIYDRTTDTLICHYENIALENIQLITAVEEEKLLFIYNKYGSATGIHVFDITYLDNPVIISAVMGQSDDIVDLVCISNEEGDIDIFWTNKTEFIGGKYNGIGCFPFSFSNSVNGFDLDSNYVYITGDQLGLYICEYEIDEETGTVIDSILSNSDTPGEALAVKVVGNFAYIADRQAGLQVIDILDKENPKLLEDAEFDIDYGHAQSVDAEGSYLAVSFGGGGIYLFDISESDNPVYLDRKSSDEVGYIYKCVFSNGELFLASRDMGVIKLKINK
ncbi:MAG: hypothetical protein H8D22_03165 [Candidatus Cloacimonetes bacterium]|nr:hypothetical protein [Candidatus Cloacimonadota bacterium]